MKPVADFNFYWYGAHQFVTGANPYLPMPGREYVILNPPYALAVLFPFGFLPLTIARVAWVIILGALFFISAKWLRDIYAADRSPLWALLLTVVFTPVCATFKLLQTAPIILLGLAGFLRYQKKRPVVAGAFLFLVAFKPQLAFLIWPALFLQSAFGKRWKPVLTFMLLMAMATLCVWAVRPSIFGEYFAMIQAHRAGFYETSTIATILREMTGVSWLQFVPAIAAILWFNWHWDARRSAWNWKDELPLLVLVSIIATSYAWFSDEVILMPAIFAAFARIRKDWEPWAIVYIAANMLGLVWAVEHYIAWLASIPIVWLIFYWKAVCYPARQEGLA